MKSIASKLSFVLITALMANSCHKENGKKLILRVDARTAFMTIQCIDELEITFRGTGDTTIKGSSNGSWRNGVNYATETEEGQKLFVIYITGAYIREVLTSSDIASQHQFDLPISGLNSEGKFEVRGYWKYNQCVTGSAYGLLELPDSDNLFILSIRRTPEFQNNLCPREPCSVIPPPDASEIEDAPSDFYPDEELQDLIIDELPEEPAEIEMEIGETAVENIDYNEDGNESGE